MANKPEIDVNGGGDDEPKEIQKSKFWHKLFVGQKKLAIVLTTMLTLGGLGKVGDIGYEWAKDKIKTEIDKKSKKSTDVQERHGHRIDSICKVIDSVKMELRRDDSILKKVTKRR